MDTKLVPATSIITLTMPLKTPNSTYSGRLTAATEESKGPPPHRHRHTSKHT